MQIISDADVERLVTPQDALAALRVAFHARGAGRAANLRRHRASCGGTTISAMGAVFAPGAAPAVAGVKAYTTVAGRFSFCITLFDSATGQALAVVEGNALTALRTAAVTLLAAESLAAPVLHTLALFGTGVQARAHAEAFAVQRGIGQVRIAPDAHGDAPALAAHLAHRFPGLHAYLASGPADALAGAQIAVLATRATAPLFDAAAVAPGTFVAAIGSSKPDTREVSGALLARCAAIAVEDRDQALAETGDFVLAEPGSFSPGAVIELSSLVRADAAWRRGADDITLYKSVGIGLEDVALAALALHRLVPS